MVSGDLFSSLMMLCYCVSHVLGHFVHWNCCIEEMRSVFDLLEFEGRLARKLRFHFFNFWILKEASHESFVFNRFHLFNSWNLKDASHESFVFISSTLGIRRTPRTKASFSSLQLVEFEGRLARKLRFQSFSTLGI